MKICLLTIFTTIIIFGIFYYNSLSVKTTEPFNDPTTLTINPISNQLDSYYLQTKGQAIYDIKIKLNKLKEKLYSQKLSDILQLKTVINNSMNKFDVKHTQGGFNNVFTIYVPSGEQGPQGPIGDPGEPGDKGDTGPRGHDGNCGLLIK